MACQLTPEDSKLVRQSKDQSHQTLITPPLSAKPSSISIQDKSSKAVIVNKYITEASVFIISLWKNPNTINVSSLFNTNMISQRDYERFTREVLKRSRCSLVALQVAMYYLFKLQHKIRNRFVENNKFLMCPKRTFLICLILSFKFNYDSNYSFKSWSQVSGLPISEIKSLEFNILKELDYNLNCSADVFNKWESLLGQALSKIESLISKRSSSPTCAQINGAQESIRKRHLSTTHENESKRIKV